MINRIFKTINNKRSKYHNFFFFLRYIFVIFFISTFLYLSLPKFLNHQNQLGSIKDYLAYNYKLELKSLSSLEFNIFPQPNLSLKNVEFKINNLPLSVNSKNLRIFLSYKDIYNFDNLKTKKIELNSSESSLDISKIADLLNYFKTLEHKLIVKNLDLNLKKKTKSIIEIKNISFSSNKNEKIKLKGLLFNERFLALFYKDSKKLKFEIPNAGVNVNIDLNQSKNKKFYSGTSNISILRNYLKLNFSFNSNQIIINKSNVRNQDLSISLNSLINFYPFFESKSNIHINKFNKELISKIKLKNIFSNNKYILERLNSNSKITYDNKLSRNSLIKNISAELKLAHGRLMYTNNINFLGGSFNCKGSSLLTEEYPRMDFDCKLNINDKKKLFKKISVPNKFTNNKIDLVLLGSLNLFNKKINFEKIQVNNQKSIKQEDKIYFKEIFERILFDENFFSIFKTIKIKEFILEII